MTNTSDRDALRAVVKDLDVLRAADAAALKVAKELDRVSRRENANESEPYAASKQAKR